MARAKKRTTKKKKSAARSTKKASSSRSKKQSSSRRKKSVPKKYKSYIKDAKTKKLYKSVIEEYTSLARIYDDRWQEYLTVTEGAILKQLRLSGKETIIDAGCGTGSLLCAIQEKYKHKGKIMGFDVTPAMLDLAELRMTRKKFNKNLSLELSHCENFSAKNNSVDVVICSSVFHHLPHPEQALTEFHRVLKKNGRLLLLDFCTDFAVTRVLDCLSRLFHRPHHMAYNSTEMRAMLKKHGFKVKSLKTFKATALVGVMLFEAQKK